MQLNKYIIGLDLGIASIGWAVYDDESKQMVDIGVRIFDAAEHPKTKESLALPRRIARGMRVRLRRRSYRMQLLRKLLVESNFITQEALDNLFNASIKTKNKESRYDVYYLRYKALTQELSNTELTQVLIHLAKHRGFKSNRKNDKSIDGVINNSLKHNQQLLKDNNYKTIGEMLYLNDEFKNKRNKFGAYNIMLLRSSLEEEAKLILETQANLGKTLITEDFIEKYLEIFNQQKSYDYRNNIEQMVGKCTFEPTEARASKACFSTEKFIALSKLNNIQVNRVKLDAEQIRCALNHFMNKKLKKPKATFKELRTVLKLDDKDRFNFVKYTSIDNFKEDEEKTNIKELFFSATNELRNNISNKVSEITWQNLSSNPKLLDAIGTTLTNYKEDNTIRKNLLKNFENNSHNFTSEEINQIIEDAIIEEGISFKSNINLSLKVLYKIIPELEKAYRYDEAIKNVGYHHSQKITDKFDKLPSIQELGLDQELTNPVVIRAISQTRKVINAIIAKYGKPFQINIELARDIGKSAQERNIITKNQKKNEEFNQQLKDDFYEKFHRHPIKDELIKFKLWKQQESRCMYSDEYINLSDIQHSSNNTQIDHIIPYSRSCDDSLSNKVLCLTRENQNKSNQTPFEYIGDSGHNPDAWHKFIERCKSLNKNKYSLGFNYTKLNNLLLTKIDTEKFIERNLNDTRYIARFCLNYLENYLSFADKNHKKPVRVLTGQVTAYMRSHWGFKKDRAASDKHHAQDAAIVSVITNSMVQKITSYSQAKAYGKTNNYDFTYTNLETGEIFDRFPVPYDGFRDRVQDLVRNLFVSRMPTHKNTGSVHADTIRSTKYLDTHGVSTIKKRLVDSGITIENDEIKKLCHSYKQHNPNIYNLIKTRLEEHDNDCKKAFKDPLYAPRKDGSISDVEIKTVKIIETQNTGVFVNNGIADNGDMLRIDIFTKAGKNYIVPIYVKDILLPTLPNKAIIGATKEQDWEVMDDSYAFKYSLYKNDLIKIIKYDKSGAIKEEYFGYYSGCHRGGATISIIEPDRSAEHKGIGIKFTVIEKYHVDVLGVVSPKPLKPETRVDYKKKKKINNA